MKMEADGITARMENLTESFVSGMLFHQGTLAGRDVVVAVSGVGKVWAAICAQTMIMRFEPDEIVNVGIAGVLDPSLKLFDVVVADEVCQHDYDTTAIGDEPCVLSGFDSAFIPACPRMTAALARIIGECGYTAVPGRVASGDRFVDADDERRAIAERTGAIACEMEGGAVAQVCAVNRVDFAVLRTISDSTAGDYARFAAEAAERSAKVICAYVASVDGGEAL